MALQALSFVGSEDPTEGMMLPPVRRYADPFIGDWRQIPFGVVPDRWDEEIWPHVADGLDAEERAYLSAVAAHPAHAELALVARASGLDVAGTRWPTPLPDGASLWALPIPKFKVVREAAYARVVKAALELADGRPAEAERSLREVVSAGFVLADHGTTLIENLIGTVIVATGANALEGFYGVLGRNGDAEMLRRARDAASEATEIAQRASTVDAGALFRVMPEIVVDDGVVRGMRWEYFMLTSGITPCNNMQRMVLGPDTAYTEWMEQARARLVRYPGEEEIFDIARRGILATKGEERTAWPSTCSRSRSAHARSRVAAPACCKRCRCSESTSPLLQGQAGCR